MKLPLDECMPRRLKKVLAPHDAFTVEDSGYKGLKNGRLFRAASGNYDVLITVDQNIPNQQNFSTLKMALVIIHAKSNRYEDLIPFLPQILSSLTNISPGSVVRIESQN
jgi:predicted nuclease of predicted toxin-antitoxin system